MFDARSARGVVIAWDSIGAVASAPATASGSWYLLTRGIGRTFIWPRVESTPVDPPPDPPPSEEPRQAGAGKSKRSKRRYTVEVDGEEYSVESAEEALAVLNKARETAQDAADLALTRAVKATKRPLRKVLADARKTMVAPHIVAPPAFEFLVDDIARQIDEIYSRTISSIEIATRLAIQRRAEEEDDEDILLLL